MTYYTILRCPEKRPRKRFPLSCLDECVWVVCAVLPFILDVKFVDVPAGAGSHRRKVTQDFSIFLLRC